MSEFDMDAHLLLDVNGEEKRADRFNTSLFTHIGHLAIFDHIFVSNETEDDEYESESGMYIFQFNPAYAAIKAYMLANDFPMHLNATRVAPCDREAFDRAADASSHLESDFIPDYFYD